MIIPLGGPWRGRARARRAGATAGTVLAVAVAAAGCAAVPTGGPVQQVVTGQGGNSQPQEYSQPIAEGPGQNWSATQIVHGFLDAMASFAGNHAVAQEYLDPAARRGWRPGWAVTVMKTTPTASIVSSPKELTDGAAAGQSDSGAVTTVDVSGQPIATLSSTGQYSVSSLPLEKFSFTLDKVGGQWRIHSLPPASSPLPLTMDDFDSVYQPRDLYFLAPSGPVLVPDPVFAPLQATNTELATGLVDALVQGPTGWLADAATTAFPAGSSQAGQVKIIGPNAIVNLTGRAAAASRSTLQKIAAQVVWTLAGGPTGINSVEFEINGRPQVISGEIYQLQQRYSTWVPAQAAASSLYFIGSNGTVEELSGAGSDQPGRSTAVPGPAGDTGGPALSSIAVSPDQRWLAGTSADGNTVYTGSLSQGGRLREWRSPSGTCTSVSWDPQGNLWIAAGGDLWEMPNGSQNAYQVGLQELPTADNVTDFRVAPDGVRAVMIVDTPGGEQVQLAAITHSVGTTATIGQTVNLGAGITNPQAVSWYGTDNVMVMSDGAQGAQLDEVQLNGGQVTQFFTPGDAVSMTAASPGSTGLYAALGLSGGQITVSAGGGFENSRVPGRDPVYPG